MTEQWLSIVEYARTFKVSDMTIRRRIKTGKLHAILQDGKYFIPVAGNTVNQRPNIGEHRMAERSSGFGKGEPEVTRHFASGVAPVRSQSPSSVDPHVVKSAHITGKLTPGPNYQESDGSRLGEGTLPSSLTRPLSASETSLVDTRALLAYCEATLRKVTENERRTVEKFKSKLETLEAVLAGRDLEIKALRQQLEDLQLLVKILERKKSA